MAELTAKQRVKLALRISHTTLDDEIDANIETARAELIRVGVSADMATGEDKLVVDAVIAYCLARMAATDRDRYDEAWQYRADCLRRTAIYAGDSGV